MNGHEARESGHWADGCAMSDRISTPRRGLCGGRDPKTPCGGLVHARTRNVGDFDTIADAVSSYYLIVEPRHARSRFVSRPARYLLVKWKNCREPVISSNFDDAAYVVVCPIRDDPTAIGKISGSRRDKRTITKRRNCSGACVRAQANWRSVPILKYLTSRNSHGSKACIEYSAGNRAGDGVSRIRRPRAPDFSPCAPPDG